VQQEPIQLILFGHYLSTELSCEGSAKMIVNKFQLLCPFSAIKSRTLSEKEKLSDKCLSFWVNFYPQYCEAAGLSLDEVIGSKRAYQCIFGAPLI
jgi:hypothetical protein